MSGNVVCSMELFHRTYNIATVFEHGCRTTGKSWGNLKVRQGKIFGQAYSEFQLKVRDFCISLTQACILISVLKVMSNICPRIIIY